MKILVCDDDESVIRTVIFRLNQDNLNNIIIARNGFEAINHLREQEFDLVITDIHMPYNNGGDVLNFVRVEQKKGVPIIMLSSDAEEEVIALAKKQGVNEFIKKPLREKVLSQAVRRLLRL
jgi:CheY-like chemotaxis protein